MFIYRTQIFLHQTDAAGRLFFASQFYIMHEAFEKLAESIGLPINAMLGHSGITFPIVHAEADYHSILLADDRITVEIGVEKIGNTSVVFAYKIEKEDGTPVGTGKTVSVCVDVKTQKKTALPQAWREKFSKALIHLP